MKRPDPRRARCVARLRQGAGINLTSMMDILTTLLLFLLKSFVVEGEVAVPPPGLQLPTSTSERAPSPALVVAISDDAILVGSEKVASVEEAIAGDRMLIEPLATRLESVQRQQDEIARLGGAAQAANRVVTIQGDRDIEFRVLQRVMYTVSQSGYENIALAVLKSS